jgi:hypothetical protein
MRIRIAILAVASGMVTGSIAAAAPAEVALVESVTGTPAGVEAMDYVGAGKVIALGPRDTIVLSYMRSCLRETITGGTVTVGTDQSEAEGAKVVRSKVACDAGKMLFGSDEAAKFGGRIFRSAPVAEESTTSTPQLTLFGRSPVVEVKAPGPLSIERIDRDGERFVLNVAADQLVRGRFYDFAKWGRKLTAGGVYRMSEGGHDVVFKIDPHARPGNTPIVGRLLRMGSPS